MRDRNTTARLRFGQTLFWKRGKKKAQAARDKPQRNRQNNEGRSRKGTAKQRPKLKNLSVLLVVLGFDVQVHSMEEAVGNGGQNKCGGG